MRDFSAKKILIASEPRFLLRQKWVKMVLAAEFLAIPSSAVKIASEQRCAILVHSAQTPTPVLHGRKLRWVCGERTWAIAI